jgi:3-keto-5-aminohexanoate cleavage enzyme
MNKILLSVAPVDASAKEADPKAIAEDVIACARLGASMVHLHVRDTQCKLTDDLTYLEETIRLIRNKSNMIIEASTGGVSNLTIQQRCAPLSSPHVEAVSLNVGSVNLGENVYQNPINDVRYCVAQILKSRKKPEVEVFELGMISTMLELQEEFHFPKPLLFSIVLGHEGGAPATVDTLIAMRHFIPSDMVWGLTHAHRTDNTLLEAALVLGAKTIRIGFEDSHQIDAKRTAATNAELVEGTVRLMQAMGFAPMTPTEARAFLAI